MDYKELLERVGWGEEFSFYYNGEQYWISQNSEGQYLTKVNGSQTQCFKTSEELFQNAKVEGHLIIEIWDNINDQF